VTATLTEHAEAFAAELTETFHGVLGDTCPAFVAEASPNKRRKTRVAVHTEDNSSVRLSVDGSHCLSLLVSFDCEWDTPGTYLAVRNAKFHVLTADEKGAPLFRYEFTDSGGRVPAAHLHVHAHRDEMLFALFRGGHGKPKVRAEAVEGRSPRAEPRLSDVHFPLGGIRMRPSIEDFLQMLRFEFGIDVEQGFQDVLNEGRARWRRRQIGASVRDAPAVAARVLREMGFEVREPESGCPPERTERLYQI
jgi:hypothetical protein